MSVNQMFPQNGFFLYDSDNLKWVPRAPILYSENFALVHVAGKIYCFRVPIDTELAIVECYDIAADQWKYIGDMPTALSNLNAVTYNNLVYVLGGKTILHDYSLLRFDPECLDWTTLSVLPKASLLIGACVVSQGKIYVYEDGMPAYIEIYSIEHDLWRSGPPL